MESVAPMLRASLARRFIVFISLLILATSLSLSLFMLARERGERDEHLRQRGVSLARNLAYNAELAVLTRNRGLLLDLAQGLMRESDVVSVRVTDVDGSLLMNRRTGEINVGLVAATDVENREYGAGQASITPYTLEDGDRVEAYEVGFPVFTRRDERSNEEIGFLLEGQERRERLEAIGQVRVMLSLSAMHRDLNELMWTLGLLTSLVISVAVLLTVTLVRRMVGPLQALAAATRQIAEGRLPTVAVEATEDEIGQLAQSFNQMTSELRRSRRELEMYSAGLEEQVRLRSKELEAAQSKLVQAEKMSAVGLLVSGVAHELNNPLAGVIGFAQLLLLNNTDPDMRRKLETINRDAERCKKIVQNLQTFAREHKPQMDYVDINDLLEGTLELRVYQLKVDNIEVVTDLDPALPKTMADFYQLQRVLLNMIINAHQAMEVRGGGRVTLRTRHVDGSVVIKIEDDGPGIDSEHLGRLFDPFFTTKDVGEGTGLGLSICYGIVEEHGGRLSAKNNLDGGATFTVTLPVRQPAHEPSEELPDTETPRATDEARKKILVVDDESAILEILSQVLGTGGHHVDTAVNGEMAWRKIRRGDYDLIISDLRMPGMSGQELYAKVREWDPSMSERIIFSTGDVLSSETQSFLNGSGNSFLQKPFELDAILDVVDAVLTDQQPLSGETG